MPICIMYALKYPHTLNKIFIAQNFKKYYFGEFGDFVEFSKHYLFYIFITL